MKKLRIADCGLRIEQPMLDTGYWMLDEKISDCGLNRRCLKKVSSFEFLVSG
jgi:hypothetical protein